MSAPEHTGNAMVHDLLTDLVAERRQLISLVKDLPASSWASNTPSPGWTIRDQIAHLAFFDEIAAMAVASPAAFAVERARALAPGSNYDHGHLGRVPQSGAALLEHWAVVADRLRVSVLESPAGLRVPWYGPDMGLASMLSARVMEHWAHGFDVAGALGARWEPTDRLRHVAHLAVRAHAYGYVVRGRQPPQVPIRVELVSPSNEMWVFGPEGANERVVGNAEDFCLVLVRRRHVDDTALAVSGAAAREWLEIGQAYAGPPGAGPTRVGRGIAQ
ncbi:TIGR03084 family metal-binding protein [Streptomyces plumbiresistens]|uniref:TIGR03084 family metal-binding protein n=1 Tax=Streptomyces plumbiresistens TaxID=511811 RepID=A0ABP7SL85_9ACTN